MLFNRKQIQKSKWNHRWKFDSKPLKTVDSFIYLGFPFSDVNDNTLINNITKRLNCKATKAWFSIINNCHRARVFNPHLLCRLFDSNVNSILSYGCEIWGPYVATSSKGNLLKSMGEEVHKMFMRMTLWVNKSVSTGPLMEELRRIPLLILWIRRALNFRNRIVNADRNSILRLAFDEDSIRLQTGYGWSRQLQNMVDIFSLNELISLDTVSHINVDHVVHHLFTKWYEDMWSSTQCMHPENGGNGGGAAGGGKGEGAGMGEGAAEIDVDLSKRGGIRDDGIAIARLVDGSTTEHTAIAGSGQRSRCGDRCGDSAIAGSGTRPRSGDRFSHSATAGLGTRSSSADRSGDSATAGFGTRSGGSEALARSEYRSGTMISDGLDVDVENVGIESSKQGLQSGSNHNALVVRPVREWKDHERTGFKHHKYQQWFGCGIDRSIPRLGWHDNRFSEQLHSCSQIRSVAAFRLGCSWLGVETLRKEIPNRSLRICKGCNKNEVEDEIHFLNCEAYISVRECLPIVFESPHYKELRRYWDSGTCGKQMDNAMKDLMATVENGFWNSMGAYLIMARKIRERHCEALGRA